MSSLSNDNKLPIHYSLDPVPCHPFPPSHIASQPTETTEPPPPLQTTNGHKVELIYYLLNHIE